MTYVFTCINEILTVCEYNHPNNHLDLLALIDDKMNLLFKRYLESIMYQGFSSGDISIHKYDSDDSLIKINFHGANGIIPVIGYPVTVQQIS